MGFGRRGASARFGSEKVNHAAPAQPRVPRDDRGFSLAIEVREFTFGRGLDWREPLHVAMLLPFACLLPECGVIQQGIAHVSIRRARIMRGACDGQLQTTGADVCGTF